MAYQKIMNTKVNYEYVDIHSEVTVVLLHGWGQNIEMMKPIGDKLTDKYNVLIIDLPGFGLSDEPEHAWDLMEYVLCVRELIVSLKLKKVILVGHSFGGRISLVYASKYPVYKLVCFGSPYCSELKKLPLSSRIYKKIKNVTGLKWLAEIIKKHVGSTDYKNASPVMRNVLVKTVNQNISEYAKKITAPTLLIWGSLDTAAPLYRAYELKDMIKDSAVIVYDGATHYAYLERLNQVIKVLRVFFE